MNTAISLPNQSAKIQPSDPNISHAANLKQLLFDLSIKADNKEFSSILREAANRIREKAFGFNRQVTKRKILRLIREFEICEMEDFLDEFNLPKKEINDAIGELLLEEKIIEGRRRRWQELGKHYNPTYELKK